MRVRLVDQAVATTSTDRRALRYRLRSRPPPSIPSPLALRSARHAGVTAIGVNPQRRRPPPRPALSLPRVCWTVSAVPSIARDPRHSSGHAVGEGWRSRIAKNVIISGLYVTDGPHDHPHQEPDWRLFLGTTRRLWLPELPETGPLLVQPDWPESDLHETPRRQSQLRTTGAAFGKVPARPLNSRRVKNKRA